jgi:hypothetical protein
MFIPSGLPEQQNVTASYRIDATTAGESALSKAEFGLVGGTKKKNMTKQNSCLRHAAIAALAAVALSLPMLPVAKAEGTQPATVTQPKLVAKKHRRQSTAVRRHLYGALPAGCTWPYQNQFPPCQSTWPQGSPNYHGPRPGPTFFDEE